MTVGNCKMNRKGAALLQIVDQRREIGNEGKRNISQFPHDTSQKKKKKDLTLYAVVVVLGSLFARNSTTFVCPSEAARWMGNNPLCT